LANVFLRPGDRRARGGQGLAGHSPHEADKQHDHDEVGWILGSGLVLVQAARHKHLQAADDGGGHHLDST